MIKEAIIKLVNKGDLTCNEAKEVMLEIMGGKTTPTQNAAFLAALSTKSTKAETIDEIYGCAEAMRSLATPVPHPGMEVMEIVGTGGDGAHSFNISTTSAMVRAFLVIFRPKTTPSVRFPPPRLASTASRARRYSSLWKKSEGG